MPQIPRYIIESGIPSDTGQRYISPGQIPTALPAVTQASQQIAQSAAASAGYLRAHKNADDVLTREDMKLDVDDKFSQVKVLVGAEALRLKEQGIHPDKYPEQMDATLRNSLQWAEKNLKYPESAGAFQLKAVPYAHEQRLQSRQEALKIKYAQIGTMADAQQLEDVNAAVFAPTPGLRQAAMDKAITRISDLVSSQVWSQEKGSSQYEKLLVQVQQGQIERDAANPSTQEDVLRRLLRGDYQYLTPQQQYQKAYEVIDRVRADATRARQEEERRREEVVSGVEKDVKDLVLAKDFDTAKIKMRDYRDYFKGTEYNTWQDIIARSAEEAAKPVKRESDPATRQRVGLMVYAATTQREIETAHMESLNAWRSGMLSDADADKFTGHVQSMRVSNRNRLEDKALSNTLREYSDVKDNIRTALRVQAPFGGLGQMFNNRAQQVEAMALEEASVNWQNSRVWWDKNKVRVISAVTEAGNARVGVIQRDLLYPDEHALKAAQLTDPRFQGPRGQQVFLTQIDLMREMVLIQQEMGRLKANAAPGGGALAPTMTPTAPAAPASEPAGGVGVGGKRYGR